MDLNEDMTYNCNKLDAALQRCGFRLSNYVASTRSKSYQSVLKAIVGGQTSPDELIRLVHGRTLNKHGRETVKAAVTASFSKTDLTVLRQDRRMPEGTDSIVQGAFPKTIRTDSDHPRSQGTRGYGNHCGDRG